MRSGAATGLVSAAILSTFFVLKAGPVLAQSEGTNSSAVAPADAREKARTLFEQGQVHYSLGEYAEAIACFREAYELSSAPILLFNIAQAHRLKGDCVQAVEIYRHFVRVAPEAPHAGEARSHIDMLAPRCAPAQHEPPAAAAVRLPERPVPPVVTTPSAPPSGTIAEERSPSRRRLTRTLLIGGLGVAIGAGALALWNDHRHDQWSAEDAALRTGPQGHDPTPWIQRQDKNDALLRSIWRMDVTAGVLAGISAASILGSAVISQLPERGVQVSLQSNGVQLAWRATWP